MKIGCIVQARLGSKRFPGKILKKIKTKTILEIIKNRLEKIKSVNTIIFAIPKNKKNYKLEEFLKKKNFLYYKGSEKNVLKRYYFAAKKHRLDIIVRITSDCPLIDPYLCEKMIQRFIKGKCNYLSNILKRTYPIGLDCEIFDFKTLRKSYKLTNNKFNLEHVTPYMRKSKLFKKINYTSGNNSYGSQRWTLDYPEDLKFIKIAFEEFRAFSFFSWKKLYKLYKIKFKLREFPNKKYI
jgi:spore coat polysaccharide biosynthesis protein SpsF (cytidylyltransferase family)